MKECPKCQGEQGYEFVMTVDHIMNGSWGEKAECGDSKKTTTGLAECLECGAKFRVGKLERDGLIAIK